jgi:Na+/H+ antiporter NhaD/arsenite permease-like protein
MTQNPFFTESEAPLAEAERLMEEHNVRRLPVIEDGRLVGIISKGDLWEIEWTTLVFFIGLFITVEAIVQVGIIEAVAEAALRLTGGSLPLTSMLLLWGSAFGSGIVDNIPYTATMIPVVENLGQSMPIMPLWWSLALGACLGGNATLVGAAANVVVANLAEKSGHPISFKRFLGYGLVITVMSLLLATGYVWLRYL